MKRLLSLFCVCALLLSLTSFTGCVWQKHKYEAYSLELFDTYTSIVGYEVSQKRFDEVAAGIQDALTTYHRLYDIYTYYGDLNNLARLNHTEAGTPLEVDQKIIDLLLYAKEVYTLTNGKTNIAMGSVLSIWHDYRTKGIKNPLKAELPPMDALTQAAANTNLDDVIIDDENNTVTLATEGLLLDVGAIAKGYAVERVAQELEAQGISGYLLNVGGNVRAIGPRADGTPWLAGVENPAEEEDPPYVAYLHLTEMALVTSGSSQRYYTVKGVKYHHIIDPDTLMPAAYFLSVTVLCPHSGLADGLSTALFSMPYEDGLAMIEGIDGVEALWVLHDGTVLMTDGFSAHTVDR